MRIDNLYARIKVLHPTIQDHEFELRDRSDGNGPFISRWDFAGAPEPTEAQLRGVNPANYTPPLTELEALESALIKKGTLNRSEIDAERSR